MSTRLVDTCESKQTHLGDEGVGGKQIYALSGREIQTILQIKRLELCYITGLKREYVKQQRAVWEDEINQIN